MTATLSLALLERAYGRAFNAAQRKNAQSVLDALTMYGFRFGLLQPHRTVQFLAQLMHESGGFIYDREVWGPTKAQKGYEGRKDLGNLQKGDGSKFRGRGPIQVTGRDNYRSFTKWAKTIDPGAPNFETTPDKINTDPWEGVSPIWYWEVGNPDRKSLNRLADRGDIENITRKINGGLNGYEDRLRNFDRLALAFLGYAVNEMPKFQKDARLKDASGRSGPITRAALHSALLRLSAPHTLSDEVAAAPVVEEKEVEKPVAVTPPGMDAPWYQSKEILGPVAGGGGAAALSAIGSIPWENLLLILAAFAAVGLFLYWRKRVDAKVVEKATQRVEQ